MANPPGQGNLFEQPSAESSGLIERSLPLSAGLYVAGKSESISSRHLYSRIGSGINRNQQNNSTYLPVNRPIH